MANVVVNLIGVRLMRLIDVDEEIARIEEEIMKLTKAIEIWLIEDLKKLDVVEEYGID